jgi:hypothetical protein
MADAAGTPIAKPDFILYKDANAKGSTVEYYHPTSATQVNPYNKNYETQAYFIFESDKQNLAAGKPLADTLGSYAKKSNYAVDWTGSRFPQYAGIPVIFYTTQPMSASEKDAMYKQIAIKYSSSEALNAGVPQSYVDQAEVVKKESVVGSPEWWTTSLAEREAASKANTIETPVVQSGTYYDENIKAPARVYSVLPGQEYSSQKLGETYVPPAAVQGTPTTFSSENIPKTYALALEKGYIKDNLNTPSPVPSAVVSFGTIGEKRPDFIIKDNIFQGTAATVALESRVKSDEIELQKYKGMINTQGEFTGSKSDYNDFLATQSRYNKDYDLYSKSITDEYAVYKSGLNKLYLTPIPASDIFGTTKEQPKDIFSKGLDTLGGYIRSVGGMTETKYTPNIVDAFASVGDYLPIPILKASGVTRTGAKQSVSSFGEVQPYGEYSALSTHVSKTYLEPTFGKASTYGAAADEAEKRFNAPDASLTDKLKYGSMIVGLKADEYVIKDPGSVPTILGQAVVIEYSGVLGGVAKGTETVLGGGATLLGIGKSPITQRIVLSGSKLVVPAVFGTVAVGEATKTEEGWFTTTQPTAVLKNVGPLGVQAITFIGGTYASGYRGGGLSLKESGVKDWRSDTGKISLGETGRASELLGEPIYSTEVVYPQPPKPIDGSGRAGGLTGDLYSSKLGKVTGEPSYAIESVYPKSKPIDGTGRVGSLTGDVYSRGNVGLQVFDVSDVVSRGVTKFEPIKTYGTTQTGKSVQIVDMRGLIPEGYTPRTYGYSTTTVEGVSLPTVTVPDSLVKGDWRTDIGGISMDGVDWRSSKGDFSIGEVSTKTPTMSINDRMIQSAMLNDRLVTKATASYRQPLEVKTETDMKVREIARAKGYDVDAIDAGRFKVATPQTYSAQKPIQLPKVEYLNKQKPVSKPSEFKGGTEMRTGTGQTLMMEPLKTKTIQTLDLRPEVDLRSLDMEPKTRRTQTIFKEAKTLELRTEAEVKGKTELEVKLKPEYSMTAIVFPKTYAEVKARTELKQEKQTILVPQMKTMLKQEQIQTLDLRQEKVVTQKQERQREFVLIPQMETKQIVKTYPETKLERKTELVVFPKQERQTIVFPKTITKTEQTTSLIPRTKTIVDTDILPKLDTTTKQGTKLLIPPIKLGDMNGGGGGSPFNLKRGNKFTEVHKYGFGIDVKKLELKNKKGRKLT